jgi:uncharacterized protein YacL
MNEKIPDNRPGSKVSSRVPAFQAALAQSQARAASSAVPAAQVARAQGRDWSITSWEFWIVRAALALAIGAACYALAPFALHGVEAAATGFLIAMVILLAEFRLRHASVGGLVGGACGALAGIFAALLLTMIITRTAQPPASRFFLEITSVLGLTYLGGVIGFHCGAKWVGESREGEVASQAAAPSPVKLLDTSVLIDGRIAEICEAHFLDGVLAVPQFVLHELQLVADSSDPLKRQRGRRGLEVLQRIQKMPQVEVRVMDDDFSHTADVDHKLIELARKTGAKIVTNDFNLNKVATVQGFCVLNVNELANALKPAVLPGEAMHVLIQREGKEPTQGVAYLGDGTMVVVDGARRLINKAVDIIVTSVHQTTAGKMIFGRVDDRSEPVGPLARAAAVGRGTGGNLPQSYSSSAGSTREAPIGEQDDSAALPEPDVE